MAFQIEPSRSRGKNKGFFPRYLSISTLFIFMSVLSAALAYDMEVDNRVYESRQFKNLQRQGRIHIDPRQPPALPGRLQRRQEQSSTASTTESVATESVASTSTASSSDASATESSSPTSVSATLASQSSSSSTHTSTMASATVITTPLPVPFDTSLGSNFTSPSCPDFFSTFLSNATFKSCSPVSLLLQNSNSFFNAERDATLLSETLDIACNQPLAICSPLMTSLAEQLIATENCGDDYAKQNPLVSQAHAGLIAYEPLYRATCLKDHSTGSYCFSEAITNSSAPADSYPYYTALGLTMPTSSRPTCNTCLQETMEVFAGYAADTDQPLAATYQATAYQIDLGCGPTFVNTTVPVAATGGTASSVSGVPGRWGMLAGAAIAVVLMS